MHARTISVIFPAMLMIATAFAQPPTPEPTQTAPDLDQLTQSAHAAYLKGDYPAARFSLDQAWSAIQPSPPSEPKRYEIAKQFAAVLSAAGDYAAALEYQQVAIDWREAN